MPEWGWGILGFSILWFVGLPALGTYVTWTEIRPRLGLDECEEAKRYWLWTVHRNNMLKALRHSPWPIAAGLVAYYWART
jgi:hypothetical protein